MSIVFPCFYRGHWYKSLISLGRHFGLTLHQTYGRARRTNNLDEIVHVKPRQSPQPKKKKASAARKRKGFQGKPVFVQGKRFPSFKAACKHYKVKRVTAKARLERGYTMEEALGRVERVDGRKKRKSSKDPKKIISEIAVTYEGESYRNLADCAASLGFPSIKAFCNRHHISYGSVRNRLKLGWSLEKVLGLENYESRINHITVEGVPYTYSQASEKYGIHEIVIRKRIDSGATPEEAVGLEVFVSENRGIVFQNKKYARQEDLAKEFNVDYVTFSSRLSLGWSLEEVLGIKKRKRPIHGRYNERYFEKYPEKKNKPAHLYFVKLKCPSTRRIFYKVGITAKKYLKSRLSPFKVFAVGILAHYKIPLYDAFKAEETLLEKYSDVRFDYSENFLEGKSECFNLNKVLLDEVLMYLNELTGSNNLD